MKNLTKAGLVAAVALTVAGVWAATGPTSQPATQPVAPAVVADTAGVVTAADAFLATLDPKQRAQVVFKFDDDQQRARWSNFPVGVVPRAGISLKEMTEPQRKAAMALLAAALSPRGFEEVQQIMEGDEVLKKHPEAGGPLSGHPRGGGLGGGGPASRPAGGPNGGDHRGPHNGPGGPGGFGGPGGQHGPMFGGDLYYISFVGTPSETDPWMLQFGGHHLGLNLTIIGHKGVLTPSHVGVEPALYTTDDGKTVRPLAGETDKAFALLESLDANQRKQAILNYEVGDLVLGPGHDGETIQPEGLKGAAMTAAQRDLMLELITEWAGIVNDQYAAPRIAEIKAGLSDTYFAWSGPTTHEPGKNGTAYFRVQGPKLVIEFAPQPTDGDLTLHVHTIYRDPTNDYGRAFIKGDK